MQNLFPLLNGGTFLKRSSKGGTFYHDLLHLLQFIL